MNALKKYLGLVWLILAPVILLFLVGSAFKYIDTKGTKDINNPVIWIIILVIFIPIITGLLVFGWYAFKGEYDHLPESSEEV
jgi:quinol-cytochrome oxidoreductase complex cytochrome b subunit